MTFKHVKFEDSPTMRALEKVAREKGLVKSEPLTKKASLVKKADLTPTNNLMENVVKLCNGLREQGFVKDAAELETKFLQYKQAQTLYETSKETGEDVLEQAHPEGSHKLVDVDSVEAVVEDLLDKHDLIEEVAEKDSKGHLPEGKLSDATSIIKAVKKVLAQDTTPDEEKDAANLEAGRKIYTDLIRESTAVTQALLANEDLSDWSYQYSSWGLEWAGVTPEAQTGVALKTTQGHIESLQGNLNDLVRKNPSVETVKTFKENLTALMNLIQKASNISGASKTKYLGRAQSIFSRTGNILKALRGEALPQAPQQKPPAQIGEVTVQADPIMGEGVTLINRLKQYSGMPQVSRNPKAVQWIKDETAEIQDVMKGFTQSDAALGEGEQMDPGVKASFQNKLNEKKSEVDDFYRQMTSATS